jgi:hypothetical protein
VAAITHHLSASKVRVVKEIGGTLPAIAATVTEV